MKVLYIGGTGHISFDCIHASVRAGHDVHVFNRGNHNAGLPDAVTLHIGDMTDDESYRQVAAIGFDAVCQFRVFHPDELRRDLKLLTGHCHQYVFISSASAYEKPVRNHVITEDVPLVNPYWEYSRNKAACEAMLREQDALPYTIMRPSHTMRNDFPTALGGGELVASRMLRGKPVVLPGDGTSLWTVTAASDFAGPFVKLLGQGKALGEAFHLTDDRAYPWREIYAAIGRSLGVKPRLVGVPTETLVRYRADWEGGLWGDKAWSVTFDNAKMKSVVGDFTFTTTLDDFFASPAKQFHAKYPKANDWPVHAELDGLFDRIVADQWAVGG